MIKKMLIKDNEAGSHITLIAILLIAIVAIGAIYFMGTGEGDDTVWPDPIDTDDAQLGDWGQEILIKYEDGTLQSVKPLIDNPTLTIWYEGKSITGVQYRLKAKASGGSDTKVSINPTGYSVECVTFKASNPAIPVDSYTLGAGGNIIDLYANDVWKTLVVWDAYITGMIGSSLSDGTYNVAFTPQGNLEYKVGSDAWKVGSNPDMISLIFTKTGSGGQIVVVFGGSAIPG